MNDVTPTTTITTVHPGQMLTPVSDIVTIKEQFLQYEKLKASLLTNDDLVSIKGKKLIKKSGFRKLATAFGISIEILSENKEQIEGGFVRHITAKAIAPGGRFTTCCASCASTEKTFNKLENDVRATAQTRASNRAISDLIGAGEVSAEEVAPATTAATAVPVHATVTTTSPAPQSTSDSGQTTITSSQFNYLKGLISARYTGKKLSSLLERLPLLSKGDASKWIQKLVEV